MAQDAFGNWVSGITPAPTAPFPGSMYGLLKGVGPPDDSLGRNGNVYVDLSTGDAYSKTGGTWVAITGGSSVAEISKGVVDPEGVVTKTSPHIYVNTANSTLWFKTVGSGNSGWEQFV